jgi:hypothetical protein
MDEIVQIGHGAIEDGPRDVRDEFRTRLVAWIVEFMTARVASKMSLVLRRQKCALMVIKPPRQLLGRGVFEIYDYVFVVSELLIGNVLPGLMSETFVFDLSAGVYVCFIEA